jgi:hypothetical protein
VTADLALAAMLITSLANTGAILLGLRTFAKQLRIAAPPKEAQAEIAQAPAGSAGAS